MNKKTIFYIGLAICSLISFIFFNSSTVVSADHISSHLEGDERILADINANMYELYEISKASNTKATYSKLQTLKRHIANNNEHINAKVANWHLFIDELNHLEKQLITDNHLGWKETVAKLYLASDALIQGDKGAWREYEILILERLRLMENSFINQNEFRMTTMQANLTLLEDHLNRISLAAMLVGDHIKIDELQFRILDMKTFMLSMPNEATQNKYYAQLDQSVKGIKQTTLSLFENTSSVTVEPILQENTFPFQLASILAFIVTVTLAYISFRKYKQTPYGVKKI